MAGRRLFWLIAAAAVLNACADSATGVAAPAVATTLPPVELGPLPTTAATVPVDEPSTTSVPVIPSVAVTTTTTAIIAPTATTTVRVVPKKSSCTALAYIGDSVSLGMISAATLTIASTRLDARMAGIGVADLRVEVSGGRSIVETLPGQENAVDVVGRLRETGFSGCWVVAIGTNDAANIAAGAARQADERIVAMMSAIGTDRVLWIDAATVADSGFWASPNIVAWNGFLASAADSYPNLQIAPWSRIVRPEWFESDGIHPNAAGSAGRVEFVTAAVLANFPST